MQYFISLDPEINDILGKYEIYFICLQRENVFHSLTFKLKSPLFNRTHFIQLWQINLTFYIIENINNHYVQISFASDPIDYSKGFLQRPLKI